MTDPKPPTDPDGRTHHDECWRTKGHHDCAIRRIEALELGIDATMEMFKAGLDDASATEAIHRTLEIVNKRLDPNA